MSASSQTQAATNSVTSTTSQSTATTPNITTTQVTGKRLSPSITNDSDDDRDDKSLAKRRKHSEPSPVKSTSTSDEVPTSLDKKAEEALNASQNSGEEARVPSSNTQSSSSLPASSESSTSTLSATSSTSSTSSNSSASSSSTSLLSFQSLDSPPVSNQSSTTSSTSSTSSTSAPGGLQPPIPKTALPSGLPGLSSLSSRRGSAPAITAIPPQPANDGPAFDIDESYAGSDPYKRPDVDLDLARDRITQANLRRGSLFRELSIGIATDKGTRDHNEDRALVFQPMNSGQLSSSGSNSSLGNALDSHSDPNLSLTQPSPANNIPISLNPGDSSDSALTAQEEKFITTFESTDDDYTKKYALFGVFDGHGGTQAASYAQNQLHHNIINHSQFYDDIEKAIFEGFIKTDHDFLEDMMKDATNSDANVGTNACICIIYGNNLYVANCGDSAAVMCQNGNAISLTETHRPSNPTEKARVEAAGGVIHKNIRLGHPVWNPAFVNLGVTRAIGDAYFKQEKYLQKKKSGLIPDPEIRRVQLTKEHQFIIIASDGFWDEYKPQEAVDFVRENYNQEATIISQELTNLALTRIRRRSPKSIDNVTVLTVKLKSALNVGL